LYETACRNAEAWHARYPLLPPIGFAHADATDWPLPEEPVLIFLFNPFGPAVLGPLLEGLRQSLAQRPRGTYLLYYHPVHRDLSDGASFLRWLRESRRFNYVLYGT
jgi:hypothetical protein